MSEPTSPANVGSNDGFGVEALAILRELVAVLYISPNALHNQYDFEKFSGHHETCPRPRGDQGCGCGYSAVSWNLETLLNECTGYQGPAPMDKARDLLRRVDFMTPNA